MRAGCMRTPARLMIPSGGKLTFVPRREGGVLAGSRASLFLKQSLLALLDLCGWVYECSICFGSHSVPEQHHALSTIVTDHTF